LRDLPRKWHAQALVYVLTAQFKARLAASKLAIQVFGEGIKSLAPIQKEGTDGFNKPLKNDQRRHALPMDWNHSIQQMVRHSSSNSSIIAEIGE